MLWCGCRVSTTVSQTFLALAGARHKLKASRASTNILAVNNHVLEGLLLLSAGDFSFLLRLPEIRAHSSCIMLHQEEPEASVELLEFFCFLLFGNLRAHFIQKREIQTLHQVRVLQVTSGVVGMTQKKMPFHASFMLEQNRTSHLPDTLIGPLAPRHGSQIRLRLSPRPRERCATNGRKTEIQSNLHLNSSHALVPSSIFAFCITSFCCPIPVLVLFRFLQVL